MAGLLTHEQVLDELRAHLEVGVRMRSSYCGAVDQTALKDVPGGAGDPLECAICPEQSKESDWWKEMPCGHRFHGGCLDKWLDGHATCPLCRHRLTPPPPPDMTPEEWLLRLQLLQKYYPADCGNRKASPSGRL